MDTNENESSDDNTHPFYHSRQKIDKKNRKISNESDTVSVDRTLRNLIPHIFPTRGSYSYQKSTAAQKREKAQVHLTALFWQNPDGESLLEGLHSTANELKEITQSAGYLLYVIDEIKNEIFICSRSQNEIEGNRYTWRINKDQTIATYVAREKKSIIFNDSNSVDARFVDGQDLGDFYASNILAVPVQNAKICVAVLEFYRLNGMTYGKPEIDKATYLTSLAAYVIVENRNIVMMRKKQELNDELLETTIQCLKTEQQENEDNHFKNEIINHAQWTVDCESVTFFLLNEEGRLNRTNTNNLNPVMNLDTKKYKMRVHKETQIAELVKDSKVILNFEDVFNDPRFDKEVDRKIGLLIRSVLGCGIAGGSDGKVGVLIVINKLSEDKFSNLDEQLMQQITKYFCIGLESTKLYLDFLQQQRGNIVLNEVLIYQITRKITTGETYSLDENIYIPESFHKFTFIADDPLYTEIPKYIYYIFNTMASQLLPDKDRLYKFVFAARKIYRDENSFHNFFHAFQCMHMLYLLINENKEKFTQLEILAMLMAGLLHDTDHRGLSAKYLELTKHAIINKREESPLEAYHYSMGKNVIEVTGVLNALSSDQLITFYKIFKECILATNLVTCSRRLLELSNIMARDNLNWETNHRQRVLIRTILMSSADLNSDAKTLEHAKSTTRRLYDEFFKEGDLMQQESMDPPVVHDRKNIKNIPGYESAFHSSIVKPTFHMLYKLFPNTEELYLRCKDVGYMWKNRLAKPEESITSVEQPEKSSIITHGEPNYQY